jgi:hypothetical protein
MERGHPLPKPDMAEQYGMQGFGGAPQYPSHGAGDHDQSLGHPFRQVNGQSPLGPSNGRYYEQGEIGAPPPPPVHKTIGSAPPAPRVPIKLGGNSSAGQATVNGAAQDLGGEGTQEKRKSWFKKFGKGN